MDLKDLDQFEWTNAYHPFNLSKEEQQSLKALAGIESIIIKQADKGGAIVIMDKDIYLTEAIQQLTDRSFYVPISSSSTLHISRLIEIFLDE